MTTASHPLALRIPPLAVTFLAGLAAWLIAHAVPAMRVDTAALPMIAAALALLGSGCTVLGVISFRRARTTVNPMNPDATTALVMSGIYRFTRNPMYLGFLLMLVGELTWLGSPLAATTAPAFVIYLNRFQIAPEECALNAQFGPEFIAYTARVPRWL